VDVVWWRIGCRDRVFAGLDLDDAVAADGLDDERLDRGLPRAAGGGIA
jgi:hypothetical protein